MESENLCVVVDTETTGLGKVDRILEFAAVTVDLERGEIVDEFDSLINPMRDIGNSEIHGIDAQMVSAAPNFKEAAVAIANVLDGRVLVAHNLPFDERMIRQEFDRLGVFFNAGRGMDTLRLTGSRLSEACLRYGVPLGSHHRALDDARAAANLLLQTFSDSSRTSPVVIQDLTMECGSRTLRRAHAVGSADSKTVRNRRKVLFPTSEVSEVSYLDTLDHFLEDLEISDDEWKSLVELRDELGLSKARAEELHHSFLTSLVNAALRDAYLSDAEQLLISRTAQALRISNFQMPEMSKTNRIDIVEGELIRICFTGTFNLAGRIVERSLLEARAAHLGYQPVDSVSKKGCDILVASDPSSMSGKSQKARNWGIPVISISEVPGLIDIFI